MTAHPPSSIPFLALGSWILTVGWFGFNVMSAQEIGKVSGLVAVNSLMAMVGGTLAATLAGRNDPGFAYNGPLAGLVAVCAGSDVMHPVGALAIGAIAGVLFVRMFTLTQNRLRIDDVLGVWPLHGLCGAWGGIAAGIFGLKALGGLGGVSLGAQLVGTALGVGIAVAGGAVIYRSQGSDHASPRPGAGVQRRRPQHPPHLGHARARSGVLTRRRRVSRREQGRTMPVTLARFGLLGKRRARRCSTRRCRARNASLTDFNASQSASCRIA